MITYRNRSVVHPTLHPSISPPVLRPICQDQEVARLMMRSLGMGAQHHLAESACRDWEISLRRAALLFLTESSEDLEF